jgi:hypothetical protein
LSTFLRVALFLTIIPVARSLVDVAGTGILDKNNDDVVITFAKRTAVGRAKKGQFKETPVDELLHALFKVALLAL